MREKIAVFLFTVSLAASVIGRWMAGEENDEKEYEVHFFGYTGWDC